jgi:hypothetical protein
MRQTTINHKRITKLVKTFIDHEVYKALRFHDDFKRDPDSEAAKAERGTFIPGIEVEETGRLTKTFVTVNKEFLEVVGYDDNLEGFLADYFGSDYKPEEGQPLRFRYLDGYLVNPTKVK